jgi:hypothetical protein
MLLSFSFVSESFAQSPKADTAKHPGENASHVYFIISAGDEINAFFNDRPIQVSTIEDFNNYIQTHVKSLKDSWVVVTGKPKTGTYDEVIKTLKRNKFKHITTNIKD